MAGISYRRHIPGPEPTLEQVHLLLDAHNVWDKDFAEFYRLISERTEGNYTTIIGWDERGLKTAWDTVQYIRRHYALNLTRGTSDQ